MMLTMRYLTAGVLVSVTLAAQAPPQFEVAFIRPSADQMERANVGVHISDAQVRISYFSLKDYIAFAYETPFSRIDAPEWLGQARFDIAGKVPDGVTSAQVPAMLRKLLADRFELKTHRESKEFQVYALVVRKEGLRLKESAKVAGEPDARSSGTVNVAASGGANGLAMDFGGGSTFTFANNHFDIRKATLRDVAETLSRLMDRPVIDATGLTAQYDLAFDLTPEEYGAVLIRSAVNAGVVLPPQALRLLDGASNDSFSGPLQQFGLALESRKSPLEVIVVDSMRRTPTDN
jgi:uncharacterized protein (TIGR03435 family)